MTLTDSRKQCRRRIDYRQWLTQCAPQPFLQTVDLALGTGQREVYPQGTSNVAPLIRMALQTTPGLNTNVGIAIGFFRVNARYTVRGRRAQLLSPAIRLGLMTPKEREEMARILFREYSRQDGKDVAQAVVGFQRFKSL